MANKKGYLRILAHPWFERENVTIYVACSGGSDSVATLDRFSKKYHYKEVVPLFVDHHTNESQCGFEVLCANDYQPIVKAIARDTDATELAWRIERRKIFFDILENDPYAVIVTAHHLDDAIEEYFINTMRRSRAQTMKWRSSEVAPGNRLFKPMLLNKKEQFVDYCSQRNLNFHVSDDSKSLRGRIRRHGLSSFVNSVMHTNMDTIVSKIIIRDHENTRPKRI